MAKLKLERYVRSGCLVDLALDRRCKVILQEEVWENWRKIRWIKEQYKEVTCAFEKNKMGSDVNAKRKGASFRNDNELAGCARVMHDKVGNWLHGFSNTIRVRHAVEGEIWHCIKVSNGLGRPEKKRCDFFVIRKRWSIG
nr:uncharacterized protein LOC109160503 [Ipomoea batatas]